MEEGREGEQQAEGGSSQEKGQLERSEKEELKEEPLRRTRTLERQVRIPHSSPYHPQCCQLAENSAT
jgi:hypothetical protein